MSASTLYQPYTSDEQWSRRIQTLQSTIYGPPSTGSPSLNISTDVHGSLQYLSAGPNGHIPQVINTAGPRTSAIGGRSLYATSGAVDNGAYSDSRGSFSEDPYRQSSAPLREPPEDIRPRPHSRSRHRHSETRSADVYDPYTDADGYVTDGRDSGHRASPETRRQHHNDPSYSPSSNISGKSRRTSGYGGVSAPQTERPQSAPLRGILRNRSTPSSLQGLYDGPAYHAEDRYQADFPETGRYPDSSRDPHAARREPYSAVTPVIPHDSPFAVRPRRQSEVNRLSGGREAPRTPSHHDGPLGRPPSLYAPAGVLAPGLQSEGRSLDYREPTSRRTGSRPASVIDRQPYPPETPRRTSAVIPPNAFDYPRAGGPQSAPAEQRRSLFTNGRQPRRIFFYNKGEPYYGFTNFSPHVILYDGKEYPTSEHLFQSFKFQENRPDIAEHIRTCSPYPSVALSEARKFSADIRHDWLHMNIAKMDETLRFKFSQHTDLRDELINTGDAILIEASDQDAFWGVGPDGKGRNELGQALMRLREELRNLLV